MPKPSGETNIDFDNSPNNATVQSHNASRHLTSPAGSADLRLDYVHTAHTAAAAAVGAVADYCDMHGARAALSGALRFHLAPLHHASVADSVRTAPTCSVEHSRPGRMLQYVNRPYFADLVRDPRRSTLWLRLIGLQGCIAALARLALRDPAVAVRRLARTIYYAMARKDVLGRTGLAAHTAAVARRADYANAQGRYSAVEADIDAEAAESTLAALSTCTYADTHVFALGAVVSCSVWIVILARSI